MKANPGISHILLSNEKTEKVMINDSVLTSSVEDKLLGITIDSELKFEKHRTGICNKVSQKVQRLLKKTFVESQFNYCTLIWMFHSRCLNNKVNNVHEKELKH